jgi:hypothetical protein
MPKFFLYNLITVAMLAVTAGSLQSEEHVPSVSAEVGPCTADFRVLDATSKPIYNASVHLDLVYGFMNRRGSDLEVYTDDKGQARLEGLPRKLKRPVDITIRARDKVKTVMFDPSVDCHPSYEVTLPAK